MECVSQCESVLDKSSSVSQASLDCGPAPGSARHHIISKYRAGPGKTSSGAASHSGFFVRKGLLHPWKRKRTELEEIGGNWTAEYLYVQNQTESEGFGGYCAEVERAPAEGKLGKRIPLRRAPVKLHRTTACLSRQVGHVSRVPMRQLAQVDRLHVLSGCRF
jgi:hypothetical protein